MCQTLVMFWWTADQVLEWLRSRGAIRASDGLWSAGGDVGLSDNQLVHEIIEEALEDPDLSPRDRLNLGFGIFDYFNDSAAGMYLRWEFVGENAAHPQQLELAWAFCREMLEREVEPDSVGYWLWAYWFEYSETADVSFIAVTSGFTTLNTEARLDEPLTRRIARVLRDSGPVPWSTKLPVFTKATTVPALHGALRTAIELSEKDFYGQTDRASASALLASLTRHDRDRRTQ